MVVEDDRALTAIETAGGDVVALELILLPDGEVVVVMAVFAGEAETLVDEARDGVEIEGEPALRDWSGLGR